LPAEGAVFGCFFLGDVVVPFHSLSFGFCIEVMKSAFEFPLFHTKYDDSTLTKRHVGDSHFLAVHDGKVLMH
jgi:hypothetical protein